MSTTRLRVFDANNQSKYLRIKISRSKTAGPTMAYESSDDLFSLIPDEPCVTLPTFDYLISTKPFSKKHEDKNIKTSPSMVKLTFTTFDTFTIDEESAKFDTNTRQSTSPEKGILKSGPKSRFNRTTTFKG